MKKYLLVLMLPVFLFINIMCSKSNDAPVKKTNAVTLAVDPAGCSICYQDSSGVFTPTVIAANNLTGLVQQKAHFIKVGNEVFVTGRFLWQGAASTTTNTFVTISLPIQMETDIANIFGTYVYSQVSQNGIPIPQISGQFIYNSGKMLIQFKPSVTTTTGGIYYQYSYTVTPAQ